MIQVRNYVVVTRWDIQKLIAAIVIRLRAKAEFND